MPLAWPNEVTYHAERMLTGTMAPHQPLDEKSLIGSIPKPGEAAYHIEGTLTGSTIPEIHKGPCLGAPIHKSKNLCGQYWDPVVYGDYHVFLQEPPVGMSLQISQRMPSISSMICKPVKCIKAISCNRYRNLRNTTVLRSCCTVRRPLFQRPQNIGRRRGFSCLSNRFHIRISVNGGYFEAHIFGVQTGVPFYETITSALLEGVEWNGEFTKAVAWPEGLRCQSEPTHTTATNISNNGRDEQTSPIHESWECHRECCHEEHDREPWGCHRRKKRRRHKEVDREPWGCHRGKTGAATKWLTANRGIQRRQTAPQQNTLQKISRQT